MSRPLERFYEITAWIFIILVVCVMLTACNRKTPVENAFDNVGQAVAQWWWGWALTPVWWWWTGPLDYYGKWSLGRRPWASVPSP